MNVHIYICVYVSGRHTRLRVLLYRTVLAIASAFGRLEVCVLFVLLSRSPVGLFLYFLLRALHNPPPHCEAHTLVSC